MKRLTSGSSRYGPCELCNKHADTMYMSIMVAGNNRFGHRKCIKRYERERMNNPKYVQKVLKNGKLVLKLSQQHVN